MTTKPKGIRARVKARFKPIPNARKVYSKLWSIKFSSWVIVCWMLDAAATAVPLIYGASPDWRVNVAFMGLGTFLTICAMVARMILQKDVKGSDGG